MCIRDRESNVPRSEIVEIDLQDDVLKIDGSFAICWSGSLSFTVERLSLIHISPACLPASSGRYRCTGRGPSRRSTGEMCIRDRCNVKALHRDAVVCKCSIAGEVGQVEEL